MATYTFTTNGTVQFVDWGDPSIWVGGGVPNDANADVVIPTITVLSTGQPYWSDISAPANTNFTIHSATITNNYLTVAGTLSALGLISILQGAEIDMAGGTLNAGAMQNDGIDIQGPGNIVVSGTLSNTSEIIGNGLSVTAGNLDNTGLLLASSGDLTVNVASGGSSNLVGAALTGGSYGAGYDSTAAAASRLFLNLGGLIGTDSASIELDGGGSIEEFDPSLGHYVALQTTLSTIAPDGVLILADQSFSWQTPLAVDGDLILGDNGGSQATSLDGGQITVDVGGVLNGSGAVTTPLVNEGIIEAGYATELSGYTLDIEGAVTGSGSLEVGPAFATGLGGSVTNTLKLGGAISQNVVFANNGGRLELGDPAGFTGTIAPTWSGAQYTTGDQILLDGVSFASLTGYSYTGDAAGGVLTLQEPTGAINLKFVGDFNTGSFNLSAGPQPLSTSPPSLLITDGGTLHLLNDTGGSSTDNVTSDPTVTETAFPDAHVQLVVDGQPITDDVTADANGVWSYTPAGLAPGAHTVTATEYAPQIGRYETLLGSASLTFSLYPTPAAPTPPTHRNNLAFSSTASGPHHFIDMVNFEASFPDLIDAFGTDTAAAKAWYQTYEPVEHRVETFDGLDYVASYSDLIDAFASAGSMRAVQNDGANHFIADGQAEGRTTTFNGLDYIASYGDLINAFGADNDAGAYHYIEAGQAEGRATTFDGLDYIASYSDLITKLGDNEQAGAVNYIKHGYAEGRGTTFNGLDYIAANTDLMTAFGANSDAGAAHYIEHGFTEGRSTSFDVAAYETAHPDLIGAYASNDAFLTAYIHTYKTTGQFLT
jgi:hypothetical protein